MQRQKLVITTTQLSSELIANAKHGHKLENTGNITEESHLAHYSNWPLLLLSALVFQLFHARFRLLKFCQQWALLLGERRHLLQNLKLSFTDDRFSRPENYFEKNSRFLPIFPWKTFGILPLLVMNQCSIIRWPNSVKFEKKIVGVPTVSEIDSEDKPITIN